LSFSLGNGDDDDDAIVKHFFVIDVKQTIKTLFEMLAISERFSVSFGISQPLGQVKEYEQSEFTLLQGCSP